MKVFVTGGSGLVGSTVIDLLLTRGDEVLAIDNFTTGRRDNLKPQPRLQLIKDSIVDE
jgi:UDP-glucose 4-epimerase